MAIPSKGKGTDYCGGCAVVSLDLGDDVFVADRHFRHTLSLYDAESRISSKHVTARCFVSALKDVLALEIDDRRDDPQPIRCHVFHWRKPEVITTDPDTNARHVAHYRVEKRDRRVVIEQHFDENFDPKFDRDDYHCRSAVAVQVLGEGVVVEEPGERGCTVVAPARRGKRTILISSDASFSPDDDVTASAVTHLVRAARQSYDSLRMGHAAWWHRFWNRGSFVHVDSKSLSASDAEAQGYGVARFIERMRTLQLYYMATTSRGALPPKWNASVFSTRGDERQWGSQYWVWTTEPQYWALHASDASDLADPFFRMYVNQVPGARIAARQRWGVKDGIFIPETTPFDGTTEIPEDVAQEVREALLRIHAPPKFSERTHLYAKFEEHLRNLLWYTEQADLPVDGASSVSHDLASGAEIAIQAWWRYRYTGDREWLRTQAYPLLQGVAQFYRHFVRKGEDGLYHVYNTSLSENYWLINDCIKDLAAIRGTVPLAIRASEILGVDAQLRDPWRDLLENLTPYPLGSDPDSFHKVGENAWAPGRKAPESRLHYNSDQITCPIFPFESWTLETGDAELDATAQATLDGAPWLPGVLAGARRGDAARSPITCARAGRGEAMPDVLAGYFEMLASSGLSPNGMSQFEGGSADTLEHISMVMCAMQEGLMQSVASRPGDQEIIRVFPAWPKAWDTSFRLLARGGFEVTSAREAGRVLFVEIASRRGETCFVRNPWGEPCVIEESGAPAGALSGDLLRFETSPDRRYLIYKKGTARPEIKKVTAEPARGQISFAWTLKNGRHLTGSVGQGAAIWDPPGEDRNWATAENWIDGTLPDEQDRPRIDRVKPAPMISKPVKTGIIRVGQFEKGHLDIARGAKLEAQRLLLGAELAEGSARMRGGSVAVRDLAVGYHSSGRLDVEDGNLSCDFLYVPRMAPHTGMLELRGGTLQAQDISFGDDNSYERGKIRISRGGKLLICQSKWDAKKTEEKIAGGNISGNNLVVGTETVDGVVYTSVVAE